MDKQIKIVLAEDHVVLREALASLLEIRGFNNVQQVNDGSEVLELINSADPHLILMDIHMPNMDGITATRLVKDVAPQIKVIGISSADPLLMELIYEAGADGFVCKDFALETLCPEIERVFVGKAKDLVE